MKKKVLIITPSFGIGGISVSLQSLLAAMDGQKVEVDVFARAKNGEFGEAMPNCTLLPENIWLSSEIVESGAMKKLAARAIWFLCRSLFHLGLDVYPLVGRIGGRRIHSGEYDVVIGFSETLAKFISDMPARRRILWIHCDYKRYLSLCNKKDERRSYAKIDKVVAVSGHVERQLKEIYPEQQDKFLHIRNIINVESIRERAHLPIEWDPGFDTSAFTIVSAGRLDPVKQFERIPEIASAVKRLTHTRFVWHVIGGGDENVAKAINEEIRRHEANDCVRLLSAKSNIYPYMAKADLYVCTSSSESFPLVINEAKALCVPVVSTDFPSVKESVVDGVDGYIVGLDQMAEVIAKLVDYPMHIEKCTIDNQPKLEAFYNLF